MNGNALRTVWRSFNLTETSHIYC